MTPDDAALDALDVAVAWAEAPAVNAGRYSADRPPPRKRSAG